MDMFQLTGFTPVRRKEDTLNAGRIQAEQEQEWTAARCHRLLRALTSRVAILNKEILKYSKVTQTSDKASSKAYNFPLSETRTPDDDWEKPKKKRLKQTYAGRGKGRGAQTRTMAGSRRAHEDLRPDLAPGEVKVPTPFLTRARGAITNTHPTLESPSHGGTAGTRRKRRDVRNGHSLESTTLSWQLTSSLEDNKKKVDNIQFSAYEGIYSGLETLIRSTDKVERTAKRKGAQSLFNMALRNIPAYILEQEDLLAAHTDETQSKSAINSRDMSAEIYDELESFGTSGKHWKHLRTVVRSHGLRIIRSAISDGLLPTNVCGALVSLLVAMQAFEEAETLLAALLSNQRYSKPKTLSDPMDERLLMLNQYACHTHRFAFQYRQVTKLFDDGAIPNSWLATRAFSQMWIKLIQHISTDKVVAAIPCKFLEVALPALTQSAQVQMSQKSSSAVGVAFADAARNTFMSLLTTISAMFILSDEAKKLDVFDTMKHVGYEQIISVLKSCTISCDLTDSGNPLMAHLLLSQLIIDLRDIRNGSISQSLKLDEIDKCLRVTNVLHESATFVSNLARCCGKGAFTNGFEYLQQFHQSIESQFNDTAKSNLLKFILVDSAYDFAHKNPDRKHMNYASELDLRLASRTNVVEQVHRSEPSQDQQGGFRWEEGIGEWVTATPAIKLAKQYSIGTLDVKDNEECETPYRPRVRKPSPVFPTSPVVSSKTRVIVEISIPIKRVGFSYEEAPMTPYSQKAMQQAALESPERYSGAFDEDFSTTSFQSLSRMPPPNQWSRSPYRTRCGYSNVQESIDSMKSISMEADQTPPKTSASEEESDDELSFISVSSSRCNDNPQSTRVLRDLNRNRSLRSRPRTKEVVMSKPKKRRFVDLMSDSEDELCL